ncbi:MAG: right-handed parallel beta-helix repeat-containing protein [Pyrinomonadaceae bacterium]
MDFVLLSAFYLVGIIFMVDAMAMNSVRVSSKPAKKVRRKSRIFVIVLAAFGMIAILASPFGYDYYSGKLGLIGAQPEVTETQSGRVIKVPPGGNLQGALERAQSGDIIELQAGAVYQGQVNLPNKPHTDFVTIRSSAAADLPEGKRVKPSQRSSMATITSGMLGRAAVQAANGAHHYRFVGIEFVSAGTIFNYGLVVLGTGEKRPENVPHDIEIDRSYFHPHKIGRSRRAVALNSANTTIKNSYIEGFAVSGEEAQGICGWTGTRNVRVLNNYIEGAAENIMFGGADPDNAELIPSDIEVRGNHLTKPQSWAKTQTIKTIFELKNAKRVVFANNYLENNWIGSAFRITVRNQDGAAPFSTIEDVTVKDNIIRNSGDGINILGTDDTHPSQTLKRLKIENNLFLNIGSGNGFEGGGYFILVSNGDGITINNNTVFNRGNITTMHGGLPQNFVFRDNIVNHGDYGIHGAIDMKGQQARAMFSGNVFVNANRIDASGFSFPSSNTMLRDAAEVGFEDLAGGNYQVRPDSKFAGKGSNFNTLEGVRSE